MWGVQLLESVSLLSTPSSETGNLCATDGEEVPFSSRPGLPWFRWSLQSHPKVQNLSTLSAIWGLHWHALRQACQTCGPWAACLVYLACVSLGVWHACPGTLSEQQNLGPMHTYGIMVPILARSPAKCERCWAKFPDPPSRRLLLGDYVSSSAERPFSAGMNYR